MVGKRSLNFLFLMRKLGNAMRCTGACERVFLASSKALDEMPEARMSELLAEYREKTDKELLE